MIRTKWTSHTTPLSTVSSLLHSYPRASLFCPFGQLAARHALLPTYPYKEVLPTYPCQEVLPTYPYINLSQDIRLPAGP